MPLVRFGISRLVEMVSRQKMKIVRGRGKDVDWNFVVRHFRGNHGCDIARQPGGDLHGVSPDLQRPFAFPSRFPSQQPELKK